MHRLYYVNRDKKTVTVESTSNIVTPKETKTEETTETKSDETKVDEPAETKTEEPVVETKAEEPVVTEETAEVKKTTKKKK